MHFYSWKMGLKTGKFLLKIITYLGMYYLRSRPAVDPIKFTLNKEELINLGEND